ncbi:MAG: hypothetical protein JXD23_17135 [Spirochaetales bacterium]|nr:hypothetical protein [Spirochaetales bacterium]
MIKGTKYWNTKGRLYIQEKAAWEQILPGFQMCGPTAAGNARAALVDTDDGVAGFGGTWAGRPADALSTFFATPSNWPALKNVRNLQLGWWGPGVYVPWEIPQYYPLAAKEVFGLDAQFSFNGTFDKIAGFVSEGNAVQLCLKHPGHYITALAFDDETKRIAFKDPWSADRWPGGNALPDANGNKWFGRQDYDANVEQWYIVYLKKD